MSFSAPIIDLSLALMGLGTILSRSLIFLSLLFIGAAIWILWPMVIGAQWVPTPKKVVKKMLDLAGVGPGDKLIDLGSGDGRIILMAALEFEAIAVGIEADPLRVLITRFRIRLKGLKDRVDVIRVTFSRRTSAPPQLSPSIRARRSITS